MYYSKFGPIRKLLFSTFSINKRVSVSLLPFLIHRKVLECDASCETDNKWADLTIPFRYTTV